METWADLQLQDETEKEAMDATDHFPEVGSKPRRTGWPRLAFDVLVMLARLDTTPSQGGHDGDRGAR